MSFRPLTALERRQLIETLWVKAESDRTIMQAKDTPSGGTVEDVSGREASSGIEYVPDATDAGCFGVP